MLFLPRLFRDARLPDRRADRIEHRHGPVGRGEQIELVRAEAAQQVVNQFPRIPVKPDTTRIIAKATPIRNETDARARALLCQIRQRRLALPALYDPGVTPVAG